MELNKVLSAFESWRIPCTGKYIPEYDGWQIICKDQNGRPIASVIQHKFSYGSRHDKLEIGWLKKNGELTNEDVIDWLTLDEAINLVAKRIVNTKR